VINLAAARGRDQLDEDYVARRNAVDFGESSFLLCLYSVHLLVVDMADLYRL